MSRPHAIRETSHPRGFEDKSAILRELDNILNSPQFRNSKRYPALLEYIVRSTLAGRSDLLKERTLGIEVFDRPPTYDTNADTVVRYTAGEVRKRLLLYYSEFGQNSGLRISLPAGSYVPEFTYDTDEPGKTEVRDGFPGASPSQGGVAVHAQGEMHETHASASSSGTTHLAAGDAAEPGAVPATRLFPKSTRRKRALWLIVAVMVLASCAAIGLVWRRQALYPTTAVDEFWAPVLQDQRNIYVCTGSVIFAPGNYSGVTTAGKDLDYTFVSMQIASAIAQVSDVAQQAGTATQLISAASTPLTQLRERPVILLGGYNNQWTLRLLAPLRYRFTPSPNGTIVDGMQPANHWQRDRSLPYSSADDYAVVARFRNPTIDGWVVALAGLGRNGTAAAAQFATSAHYMELLRSRVGSGFADKNIEVVLKVSVIDGKSGAPSILAEYTW
jgi:hypothetical protein